MATLWMMQSRISFPYLKALNKDFQMSYHLLQVFFGKVVKIKQISFLLTLMRATSGSLARCRGGGCHPPYLSWLWSKFWPKNHVSLRAGINSNSFGLFSEFFFQNSQKNWRKLKTYQKLLKMSENSKFCNF